MTELKALRTDRGLTQKEAARLIGISLRSYISYENEEELTETPKYRFLLAEMKEITRVDEDHGVLTVNEIKRVCNSVLENYPIQYCYLFGSYARGTA